MGAGDHRLTPDDVLEVVRQMGPIETDPFSNRWSRVGAKHEYEGILRNGLREPWFGLSFVNGPWSSLLLPARKAVFERQRNAGVEVLWWSPCYTETAWAKVLWQTLPSVCFWSKRVSHKNPQPEWDAKRGCYKGDKGSMWPTMMVYMGPRHERFASVFAPHGTIMRVTHAPIQRNHRE